MSLDWKKLELGKIIELKYGKGLSKKQRVKGEFPVYGSGGIIDFHESPLLKGPNIIVGRKGSIGTVYYEEKNCFPIDTVFYVELKDDNTHLKFVYPLLKNLNLARLGADAAVPGLNRNTALKQEVRIPDLSTQRKIASVLSTYDNLIENNTRRIQILEEMAQRIYKEWFVDFKYLGHENDKLVDSELGMIPEGWEVGRVSDLYEVKSGFAFKSKKMQDSGDFGIVKIKNIQSAGIDLGEVQYILKEDVEPRAYNFELEENDLLIAMTGAQVGKVGLMPKTKEDYFLNQRVGKFFPIPHFKTNNTFLNQLSRSKYFQSSVLNIAQGAAQPNISGKQIADIQFPLPNLKMISDYEQLCESIKNQITNLNFANVNLKETRDYLLPKLISGKIDVSDLDIDIGET